MELHPEDGPLAVVRAATGASGLVAVATNPPARR